MRSRAECLLPVLVVGVCCGELCDVSNSSVDECDLQVELIQTASILEERVQPKGDAFEDAPLRASAFDHEAPNSLVKALLAKAEMLRFRTLREC